MKFLPRRIAALSIAAVVAFLTGCASQRVHDEGIAAFEHGEYEEGVAKLTEAAHLDPGNLSYRLDLRAREDMAVQRLIAAADEAFINGRLEDAESNFRRVLVLEPRNERARNGLIRVQADRQHAGRVARAEEALKAKKVDVADNEIRAVLAEDPLYAPAVALARRIDQLRPPIPAVPHLRTHDNRPVTLEFRDAPTKMVFEVLARQTGLNFIFDKDVKSDGKTTIFVTQVPVEQAIDLILAQNQLARQILSENMVLIYPATAAKQKDYQDEIVHTFFLANAAPKDAEAMLKTVLGSKTLYVDERSSALTLRDTPEHVRMAEKLIYSLDEPEPEVIMEVEILEISHDVMQELGIQYPTSATLTPTPLGAAAGIGSNSSLTLGDLGNQTKDTILVSPLSVTINALKTTGNTNVLASPRIRARNKEKAKILVGDRVPVVTSGTSATTGGSYSTSNVQYLDVGLTLDVQPVIHNDGNVAIKMALEVSSITNTVNVPNGNGGSTLAYQISTRNANTLLELKDGETQVLAGLIQESDSRTSNHIPGIGDIPYLGRLFGTDGKHSTKSEIVMALTPRIIRAQPRPSSETTEFWFGTESQTRSAPIVSPISDTTVSPTAGAGPLVPGGVTVASGGGATALPNGPHAAPALIESTARPAAAPSPSAPPAQTASNAPVPSAAIAAEAAPTAAAAVVPVSAPPLPNEKPRVILEGPDSAKVGDEINVSVKLATGQPLGRVRTQVRFDAGALLLISAEPGDLTPSGVTPKVDIRPGGVQLELAGSADAPVSGSGSIVDMRFRAVAPRPSLTIDTQVVLLGEDGVAVAASAATPLKIAVSQ